ncbi:MAG: heme-copper oxidase subunit III [Chloroflexota bacterium]|nr:heme-copper oxidase subunit III [Chloroflexota bacterium]
MAQVIRPSGAAVLAQPQHETGGPHDHGHGDGHGEHPPTSTGLNNVKILMWTFIASEVMLFGSLISAFLAYLGREIPGRETPTAEVFNIPYTSVSAFVLLLSSLTMVLALAACQRGDQRGLRIWLVATALLGAIFIGGQYFEFTYFKLIDELWLDTNFLGSTFFLLTGFHGAHVTVGVIWLLSLWMVSLRRGIPPQKSLLVEIAGLYWHFVDVVWIIIFTVVYLIPVSLGHH